ncbi:diguanylate cyclase [uncultured Mycolicibacterium sp.]|uniref:GGDEF domain-containing protein n=1 Tax=uncultured Mycolicibacterium sp. TaxID=2320817 RepID=UPI00262795D7|nr:GGDEF domain-containing protein [uncultured Mycolicibacterium sp.]
MWHALRRTWCEPDHFFRFTSLVSARDGQLWTCRRIGLTVLTMGVILLGAAAGPAVPIAPAGRVVAVGIGVLSLAMGAMWLRGRWPGRAGSLAFAAVEAALLATACQLPADHRLGLLWASAFGVLCGYLVLFHSGRAAMLGLAVAVVAAGLPAARLWAAGQPAWALWGFVFVTALNAAVLSVCRLLLRVVDTDVPDSDLEPRTGLLNRDAFYRAATTLAARSRDDDRQLVLVLLNIDNLKLLRDTEGATAADRARIAIARTLRENTRHNALLAHIDYDEFVIADTFPTTDSFPLVERVRGAVATTPPRLTASIGVVSTPLAALASCPPDELLDELISVATTTMYEARRAGGNQARYRCYPNPTTLRDVRNDEG